MNSRNRWLVIVAGGVTAGALAWLAPAERDDLALPINRGASSDAAANPSDSSRLAALPARQALGSEHGGLFGANTPPPPSHRAIAAAPPEPVAPPNPYKVAGMVVRDGTKRVFLVNGDRVYEARQGDDLDGGYRVESISADQVVLVYVPMSKQESLPIGATLGIDAPLAVATAAAVAAAAATRSAPSTAPAARSSAADQFARLAGDPSKPAELRWEGPDKVRAGASFSLALRVTSWQQLHATPMQLTYEPKLLEPVGVRAGKFFGDGKFSYRINPDGSIFVGATGGGAAPGADAELVVVTFKPIKAGTAEVRLSSLALQGAAGRALEHNQVAAFRTAIQ